MAPCVSWWWCVAPRPPRSVLRASAVLHAALSLGAAAPSSGDVCDIVSTGPVCLNGGASILTPGPVASDLGGHWKFDGPTALDSSGRGNHGIGSLEHGPSPAGGGFSALFGRHGKHLMVPDAEVFHAHDFTYSFWVYVLSDPEGQAQEAPHWCPLLRKGIFDNAGEQFANGPALFFSRNSGHLRAAMTTSVTQHGDGEYVDSNARVFRHQWVHLAVVHHGPGAAGSPPRLLIYVNGILDVKLQMRGTPQLNELPLYVGGDPFTAKECGFEMYVDDLRFYTRVVPPHELQAEAAPAFGGVEPSFVHLGCMSCTLGDAMRSCPLNRHLCSSIELHTGGYQVAKAVGWHQPREHVWTHAAVLKAQAAARRPMEGEETLASGVLTQTPKFGLALCCEGAA